MTHKLTLNEENWDTVRKELPLRSELRSKIKDLMNDAATWGEETGEFDDEEWALLKKHCAFDWLPLE